MEPLASLLVRGRTYNLLRSNRPNSVARLRLFMAAAQRSYVTVFGYIQSQALVYSENGQPKDVL